MSDKNYYTQFTTVSYNGRKLLEQHSVYEEGLWQIKGEDPNCDMGGSHHQPDLGIVNGKLHDVIEYAVELPGFWQWGAGGSITKISNIKTIDSAANMRRKSLEAKKAQLQEEIDQINDELDQGVILMSKKYKLAVVIGRLEPMHDQHINLFNKALEVADQVVVLFGGDHRPRTIKNPLLVQERQSILNAWAWEKGVGHQIASSGVNDYIYSDSAWVAEIQQKVNDTFSERVWPRPAKKGEICLVGCEKDSSSYYLKMFPQWDLISMPLGDTLDSTQIRQLLFEGKSLSYIAGAVPEQTLKFLAEFKHSANFEQLVKEYEFIQKYKLAWSAAPYDPVFVTTDAWVVQSGHVLLIQRKKEPGHGLWAAPGGFLGMKETLIQSMLRELREETKIKVPAAVLEGSIIDSHVFDSPGRSMRGRTITHSYLIKLKDNLELPHIKAADDAQAARWVPLSEITSENMYEDHYDQITFFKNKV